MCTEITDAGATEPRRLPHGWGRWHLDVLAQALAAEGATWKEAFSPGWTFTREHTFTDPSDGEVLVLRPGDRFEWWWSR